MKKKLSLTIAIVLSAFFLILLVVKYTGMLQYFKVPTGSSKPNIQPGESIFISSLKKPERFNLIVFKSKAPMMEGEAHFVFRLCGLPGDIIEIRNGDLFVNGKSADDSLNLMKPFKIASTSLEKTLELTGIVEEGFGTSYVHLGDSTLIYLSTQDLAKLKKEKISYAKEIENPDSSNEGITGLFKKNWNADHFGPYTVPADRYFVLGDNRHQAQDSRYLGPIPIKSFVGTVLNR